MNATRLSEDPLVDTYHMQVLHEVTVRDGKFVSRSTGVGRFSDLEFSEIKYGGNAAALFAYAIRLVYDRLIPRLETIVKEGEPIVVCGTPIRRMANVAKQLAEMVELLLWEYGFNCSLAIIGQEKLAGGDYGHLTAKQRAQRNSEKRRHFSHEEFVGEDGNGKQHLVLCDDALATGSIVRSTLKMFDDAGVSFLSATVATLVRLDSDLVAGNAQLEYDLNHAAIESIEDLYSLMHQDPDFRPNTRDVRFILECTAAEIISFAAACNMPLLRTLYTGAAEDGYQKLYPEKYKVFRRAYIDRLRSQ